MYKRQPYILHPLAVAKIVVEERGLGVKSVAAALLHDVVEDTAYTVEEIDTIFGEKIAYMAVSYTHLDVYKRQHYCILPAVPAILWLPPHAICVPVPIFVLKQDACATS